MKLKIGTRGSRLALKQVDIIIDLLKKNTHDLKFEIKIIKTRGDKILDTPLAKIGGKGLFVKEIDEAVLKGDVDFAVHSAKDVPTDLLEGLQITCVPKREEINDVLITNQNTKLENLPKNATIGTSSLRRKAELLNFRNDLKIKNIRGNVDTRIKKVIKGEYDATIMSKAGLKRLGLTEHITQTLPKDGFPPSVGQGAIAVISKTNSKINTILQKITNEDTMTAIRAERAMLKTLGGGCQVPIGVVTDITNTKLTIKAIVLSPDGRRKISTTTEGKTEKAAETGEKAANQLLEYGADTILKETYGHLP